jgi:hypothetical protein
MGDAPASPERRNFVGGLLGSTGLGSNGAGVVDATPLGGLLSMQEAKNPREASLAMLGLLPGANVANKAVSAAEHAAPAAERYITAYHGSPHSFDRFDTSKIGTGEGAQVYGRGLYFSDNEDVAKGYRDGLSSSNVLSADGRRVDDMPGHEREVMNYLVRTGKTPEDAVKHFTAQAEKDNEMMRALEMPVSSSAKDPRIEFAKGLSATPDFESVPSGRMYQVRINADPEHFLDWDKPLNQQSEVVKNKVLNSRNFINRTDPEERFNLTGKDIYGMGHDQLKNSGIPGIKYLDQGSRGGGKGTSNYVVFNDDIVDIMKKYGLVGLLGGGAAYNGMGQQQQQQHQPDEM